MKSIFERGMVAQAALAASVLLGVLAAVTGMYLLPKSDDGTTLMLTPEQFVSAPGESFVVAVVTTSDIPVNAFRGMITFNESVLEVDKIDYNVSMADLWAETPWYENGEGTINFAGGTLRTGGFTGTETLLSITFKARAAGNGNLVLTDTQILMHDGMGTEAPLTDYIDTLFLVTAPESQEIVKHETRSAAEVVVLTELPDPDLNGDNKVNITDVSLFLLLLPTNNPKADFNADGRVNKTDLSILLQARSD